MTQAVMNIWPRASKSMPQGLLVPYAKTSKTWRAGMVAPDARVDRDALVARGAGLTDAGVGEDAVAAVEPAVGAPGEAVERFVGVVLSPAVEQDLGRAVGAVVAVPVGDEIEFGRRADPDAAEADLEAADQVQVVGEDLAGIEAAVAVGVFEDQDAIARLRRSARARGRSRLRRSRGGRDRRSPLRSAERRRARRRTGSP